MKIFKLKYLLQAWWLFAIMIAVASLGLVVGLIAGISIIKIRRKRV